MSINCPTFNDNSGFRTTFKACFHYQHPPFVRCFAQECEAKTSLFLEQDAGKTLFDGIPELDERLHSMVIGGYPIYCHSGIQSIERTVNVLIEMQALVMHIFFLLDNIVFHELRRQSNGTHSLHSY